MAERGVLAGISDASAAENIMRLAQAFVENVDPLKIFLFGSYAGGDYHTDSDFDFYLVVDDGINIGQATDDAYLAAMDVKNRPVDIVVGSHSRYEKKSKEPYSLMIEREVGDRGILLYDRMDGGFK